MSSSSSGPTSGSAIPARLLRWTFLAALAAFVTATAIKALRAPWAIDDFPEELLIKAELLPVIFPVHMLTGGLALLLVPTALLLNGRQRWHRPVARQAALDVALAGVTAFPVAWLEPVTYASALGFSVQGALWLVLLALGIWHIRHGRTQAHRACMLLMAAATSGAVSGVIPPSTSMSIGRPAQSARN